MINVLCFILAAVIVIISFSFLQYFVGFILYKFPKTCHCGFKLMAHSCLFRRSLPRKCPYLYCKDCTYWTCPSYALKEAYKRDDLHKALIKLGVPSEILTYLRSVD